ncbi:hypothetical protein LAZ67_9002671 [Cordylochernes scorpioides]|uniref:Reverse transcriptase domain-containing protein n=1 Tax=Cordylochernes scorpioides TaxID=51811 RepID=A0ABY6KVZ4_9ARAC|nr:hypothetical protein LAZ67_9002667 [Cordylochernes scorpioides]UYV72331.1 hypothetical protein LAZ67_9002671 [Cordylochernes scorpioides]
METSPIRVRRGLRQGCACSAALFSIFTGSLQRHLEKVLGRGNVLAYADDILLLIREEWKLEKVKTIFDEFRRASGLCVNLHPYLIHIPALRSEVEAFIDALGSLEKALPIEEWPYAKILRTGGEVAALSRLHYPKLTAIAVALGTTTNDTLSRYAYSNVPQALAPLVEEAKNIVSRVESQYSDQDFGITRKALSNAAGSLPDLQAVEE